MNNETKLTQARKRQKREYILWGVLAAAIILVLSLTLVAVLYAPNVDEHPHFPTGTQETDREELGTSADVYERKEGFYTFLIAGMDATSNNTDVLMLASLDTKKRGDPYRSDPS